MPVVAKLMDSLQRQYGAKKGERVYYAMEAEGKGPFSSSGKYHALHQEAAAKAGHPPIEKPGKRKGPAPRRGTGPRKRR
jgi:hypothetical protein